MAPRFGTLVRTLVLVIRPASRQPAATVVHPDEYVTGKQLLDRMCIEANCLETRDIDLSRVIIAIRISMLCTIVPSHEPESRETFCYPHRSSISSPVTISPTVNARDTTVSALADADLELCN